jgi:HSP20 family molecular chaperone IbpA
MTVATEQVTKSEATQVRKTGRERATFIPAVDILETAEEVVLRADLPGVGEKDLDISLESGVLTVKARAEEPTVFQDMRLYRQEYLVGGYERVFTLSDEIDQENIRASVKNGVLTLRLSKAGPAKSRKIDIISE